MKQTTKTIFETLSQTEEYAQTEDKIIGEVQKEVYDKIINPMYETDKDKADEMESIIARYIYQSEYLGFIQGIKFLTELKNEVTEL